MTIEFLGTQASDRGDVPVYVVWVDFADRALADQITKPLPCPRCAWPLHIGPLFADPSFASIAINCSSCGAQIHVDRTPVAERVNLRWLHGFTKD